MDTGVKAKLIGFLGRALKPSCLRFFCLFVCLFFSFFWAVFGNLVKVLKLAQFFPKISWMNDESKNYCY